MINSEERIKKLWIQCPRGSIEDPVWLDTFMDFSFLEYNILCEAYEALMDEKTGMSRIQYIVS